jgi:hypothetical protein
MSMMQCGSFNFEPNEVNLVRFEKSPIKSPRGIRLMSVYRMMLEVVVKKDTVAELTSRIDEINTAFAFDGFDAKLYSDDAGTVLTSHVLINSTSLSGVRVIRGPTFDRCDGAEYANKRTAIIVLEATYDTSESDLVSWRETLRFYGTGGQDYAVMAAYPNPVAFPMGTTTPQVIVQTGEAVGFVAPVVPPGPVFTTGVYYPSTLQEEGYDSALMQGQFARFYPSNWRYTMIALTPQVGYPTTR